MSALWLFFFRVIPPLLVCLLCHHTADSLLLLLFLYLYRTNKKMKVKIRLEASQAAASEAASAGDNTVTLNGAQSGGDNEPFSQKMETCCA